MSPSATRRFWLTSAAGVALPPAARAQGPVVLKLGHQFSSGSIPDRVAQRLAEAVQTHSRGALRVEVFANAAFGDER